MEALTWEPVPRETDERGRALATSAVLHALFLGLAWLAPPDVPALSLDPEAAPLVPVVHVVMPTPEAAPPAPRPGHAAGVGEGARGGDDTGRAPVGPRTPRRGARARAATTAAAAPTALDGLAALAATFERSAHAPSPYVVGTSAIGAAQARDLGGLGLDMRGVGRGAGGDAGGTVDTDGLMGGGVGFGTTCFVDEVTIRTSEGPRRELRGCVAGNVGAGSGTGFGTRTSHPAVPDLGARRSAGRVTICGVTTCEAIVVGRLSRDAVRRVVRQHANEVRACYEAALTNRPDLEGRVGIAWTIAPAGHVVQSEVDGAQTDLGEAGVESCIARAVRRWTFPQSDGVTLVRYPFLLSSAPTTL